MRKGFPGKQIMSFIVGGIPSKIYLVFIFLNSKSQVKGSKVQSE